MSFAQDALIFGVAWTHVILAPFTKVEESFSLHAMHDIIMYGVSPEALDKYDHFVFSGAVPRSFVGNLFVAFIAKSALWLASLGDLLSSKLDIQIVLRLTLATLNAAAICLLRRSVERRFGRLTSLLFTALTCSQFHIPFWMGRTVPNMFALFPVNLAFWLLLRREKNALRASRSQVSAAIFLLTFAGVVLRAEVAGLLIPFALQCLYEGSISFLDLIKTGVISGVISLATTVAVDSYFWREWPMWPEFASLFFNVVEGKSAEWGVSPPQDYFTLHLPKLLLGALPLSILGFIADARVRTFILPALAFVCLISCIGHKEWRFIVYVVPLFNIAAARGARTLVTRSKSSLFGRIVFLVGVGLIALNIPLTVLVTSASLRNYPGGDAMTVFNEMYANRFDVHVHISNLAAQTGASLFTQAHAPPYPEYLSFAQPESKNWVYNKTEGLTRTELLGGPFTHLIAEEPLEDARWAISRSVSAFAGWSVDRDVAGLVRRDGLMGVFGVLQMRREEMLWIIERRG